MQFPLIILSLFLPRHIQLIVNRLDNSYKTHFTECPIIYTIAKVTFLGSISDYAGLLLKILQRSTVTISV